MINITNLKHRINTNNLNKVKEVLLNKNKLFKNEYKPINQEKLQLSRNNDKYELFNRISKQISDKESLKNIFDLFDDYNIERKSPVPIKISSDEDVLKLVEGLKLEKQEHFVVITLDGGNNVINNKIVAMGILNELIIHPREVFSTAIEDRANSIIIVHNHPSGTLEPSSEDINMTIRIKQTSDIVGIKLLDHIIISNTGYYSFNKNDLL